MSNRLTFLLSRESPAAVIRLDDAIKEKSLVLLVWHWILYSGTPDNITNTTCINIHLYLLNDIAYTSI